MHERFSASDKLTRRRSFLASALASGSFALWSSTVSGKAKPPDTAAICGDLSAADPLYLYQSLVPRLQFGAVQTCRNRARRSNTNLSEKLKQLWTLSDQLKNKLFPRARLEPAVKRMNSLAYIGHTNAQAVKLSLKTDSAETARANLKSQAVITGEIIKASADLAQQGEKTLKADEWELLQQILAVIDEIKSTTHPAFVTAETDFDLCLKEINSTILAIQASLTNASTNVVRGNKTEALRDIESALTQLDGLPSDPAVADVQSAPEDLIAARDADQYDRQSEFLTPRQFREMLEPVRDLLNGTQRVPRVSRNGKSEFSLTPIAYVSPREISLVNSVVDPLSVREIVRECFISGHWLQVAGVTAACLPLWSAYGRSEQRKVLIHSALYAIPRGKSKLWEAAYYLNNLT